MSLKYLLNVKTLLPAIFLVMFFLNLSPATAQTCPLACPFGYPDLDRCTTYSSNITTPQYYYCNSSYSDSCSKGAPYIGVYNDGNGLTQQCLQDTTCSVKDYSQGVCKNGIGGSAGVDAYSACYSQSVTSTGSGCTCLSAPDPEAFCKQQFGYPDDVIACNNINIWCSSGSPGTQGCYSTTNPGTHGTCQGNACVQVQNAANSCTGPGACNSDAGCVSGGPSGQINAACGSSNGQNFVSAPTSGLCSVGNASSVSGSGPWSWTCNGISGGTNASCSANYSASGACPALSDPASKIYFEGLTASSPSTLVPVTSINVGDPPNYAPYVKFPPGYKGPSSFTYPDYPNYPDDAISGNPTVAYISHNVGAYWYPFNYVYGVSAGTVQVSYNYSNLDYIPTGAHNCSVSPGTLTVIDNSPIPGACGNANGRVYPNGTGSYAPDSQCQSGTASNTSFPSAGNSVSWTCAGPNGGANSSTCSASQSNPPPVSATLSADSTSIPFNSSTVLHWTIANATSATITSSPSDSQFNNRSSTNTAGAQDNTSNLIISTTYTLTAQGFGGPVTSIITVNVSAGPINGSCGSGPSYANGKTYSYGTNTYVPDSQCQAGAASSTSSNLFPAAGGSATWVCRGQNGGSNSSTCSASQAGPPVCPSSGNIVTLDDSAIDVGGSTLAHAPAGWFGGNFDSSDNAIAFASGSTINGASGGNVTITGSNWTAPNGATACSLLVPANLSVKDFGLSIPSVPGASAGNNVNITVNVGSINGGTMPVTVTPPSNASLPSGWSITQTTQTTNAGGSVVFVLTTTPAADVTTHNLNFVGTYNSVSRQANTDVTVTSVVIGDSGSVVTSTGSCGQISLTWTAGSNATGYNIYRSPHGSPPGAAIATNINALTYTDTSEIDGTSYDYWVESVGGSGTKVDANTNSSGVISNACAGPGSVTLTNSICEQVVITWPSVGGASSYNVYRNETGSAPVLGDRIKTGAVSPYADNTPLAGHVYYYWVSAIVSGKETQKTAASGSVGVTSCDAGLDNADKDIVGLNNVDGTETGICNGSFNNGAPGGISTFKIGDLIKFEICLPNKASATDDAKNIVITDTLTNLVRYQSSGINTPAAWNAAYTGGSLNSAISVSGTEGSNLVLTFTLPGSIAPGGSEKLTFWAKTSLPSGFGGTSSRFQNSANICFKKNATDTTCKAVTTPLILFSGATVPSRGEVGP